jgi:hypothetical protein
MGRTFTYFACLDVQKAVDLSVIRTEDIDGY